MILQLDPTLLGLATGFLIFDSVVRPNNVGFGHRILNFGFLRLDRTLLGLVAGFLMLGSAARPNNVGSSRRILNVGFCG